MRIVIYKSSAFFIFARECIAYDHLNFTVFSSFPIEYSNRLASVPVLSVKEAVT